MTASAEQLRKFRTQGFQDGYHGRERRWSNPVYVEAYRRGAQKWTREAALEVASWERPNRG